MKFFNSFFFQLTVDSKEDINRQIVKADSASFKIPEVDFEVCF